jgi:uncharacterized protein (DUF983 family)
MKRALLLLLRALLLRCPRCGSGGIFLTMFKLRDRCPRCDLRLEREAGSFTGSMTFNLVFSEIVWVLCFVGILVGTWPNPPWQLLQWGSVALMLLFPVLFFPFSKTLWLALDLGIRPSDDPTSGAAPP